MTGRLSHAGPGDPLTNQIAGSAALGASHLVAAANVTPAILATLPPPVQGAIAEVYSAAMPRSSRGGIPVGLVGWVLAYSIHPRPMKVAFGGGQGE